MPKRELTEEEQLLRERLGARIRSMSADRGIKPADIASACGVSLATQYRIESGELTADVLYLVKAAELLQTSVDGLLARTRAGSEAAAKPMRVKMRMGDVNQVSNHPGSVQVGYAGGGVSVSTSSVKKSQKKAR